MEVIAYYFPTTINAEIDRYQMNAEMIDFINEYAYSISQVYNKDGKLLWSIDCEKKSHNTRNYKWDNDVSADFINRLYQFSNNDKILFFDTSWWIDYYKKVYKSVSNCTFEIFQNEFLPGRGYYFNSSVHEFHIFYFDYFHVYYAGYDQDRFVFQRIKPNEVLEFIGVELNGGHISHTVLSRFVSLLECIQIHELK